MTEIFFENKKTKMRFRIVKFDKAKGTMVLKGKYREFEEKYDKARFERLGYELVQEEIATA